MPLSYYNNLVVKDFNRMGRVWNLFSNLGFRNQQAILEESRKGDAGRYDFSVDLIRSASRGASYLDEDNFNLAGYDYRVRTYQKIAKFKELEELAYIVTDGEIEARGRIGYGEVSERSLADSSSGVIDDVESFTDGIDYEIYWAGFPELVVRSSYLGYDLAELLVDAINGSLESMSCLAGLAEEYPPVSEFLHGVLIKDKYDDVVERVKVFIT